MALIAWLTEHWSLESIGIVGSLIFSGLSFWVAVRTRREDIRARRAQTFVDITKLHRGLWIYFDDRPELKGLLDRARDIIATPLTDQERRFANFLFLQIRATREAEKADIYRKPERLTADLREIFSHPGVRAAWISMKHLHDGEFVSYIEAAIGGRD